MTRGSSLADTIFATSDGEFMSGLDGDDTLSSTFNNTRLLGGNDNDMLTSMYAYTVPNAEFFHDANITQRR